MLDRYNTIAARLGYLSADRLPEPTAADQRQGVRDGLCSGRMGLRTTLLWLGYSCLMASFYFANSWTPKLLTDITGDAGKGTAAGVLINLGGVLGALVFAVLTMVIRARSPPTRRKMQYPEAIGALIGHLAFRS